MHISCVIMILGDSRPLLEAKAVRSAFCDRFRDNHRASASPGRDRDEKKKQEAKVDNFTSLGCYVMVTFSVLHLAFPTEVQS
jgi:hypothetical protein